MRLSPSALLPPRGTPTSDSRKQMGFMGFGALLAGLYWLDCAIKGRAPIASLRGILSSTPGSAGASASSYNGTLAPVENLSGNTDANSQHTSLTYAPGNAAAVAVQFALAQVGKPYKYGATGPDSYDCSGLCFTAYKHAGITIGRTTGQQILSGTKVDGALQPGDLVFPDLGHVEMVIGNGQTVQAPHTGKNVYVGPTPTYIAARRIVPITETVVR